MEFAHSIGRKGNCTGEFDRPRSLAITAEGNIVVADTGELSFFVCDAFDQRTFLSDNFSYFCQSLYMSLRIYMLFSGNQRVQVFSCDGEYLFSFGDLGKGPGQFKGPHGLAVDEDNNIFVSKTSSV